MRNVSTEVMAEVPSCQLAAVSGGAWGDHLGKVLSTKVVKNALGKFTTTTSKIGKATWITTKAEPR